MFTLARSGGEPSAWSALGGIFVTTMLALLLSFVAGRCGCGNGTPGGPGVYTTHQFLSPPSATKGLGESCVTGGGADCISTSPICAHFGSDPAANWACSITCASVGDCPSGWDCRTIVAGYTRSDGKLCMPPNNWVPALTTVRASAPSPTKAAGDGTGTPVSLDGGR